MLLLAPGLATGAAAQVIAAEDAARHVGEEVTVEGGVATVVCSPLACLVSFSADYSGLVVSIPGEALGRFPPPKETYADRRVRVHGTIIDRNGRPRIEVVDPGALQVVGGGGAGRASGPVVRVDPSASIPLPSDAPAAAPPAPAPAASAPAVTAAWAPATEPPPPPVELPPAAPAAEARSGSRVIEPGFVTTRAGGPRPPAAAEPRGESLVSRLSGGPGDAAAVESRSLQQQVDQLQQDNAALAATVEALQERLTVLEQGGGRPASNVDEGDLPYLPDYVVPGEGATRLQHVKRGWSSERVLRAIGPPVNTTTEANGYMTWYYPDGRAVTLDPRGRVTSSVGF